MSTVARPVSSNATVALLGQWSKLAVQIASLLVFSRLLSPSELGLVAMVTAIVGVAAIVGDLGLSLAAIQAPELSQAQRSNLFWMNTALGLVMALAVLLAAPMIGMFYVQTDVQAVAMWLSVGFVIGGVGVQFRVELNRAERFRALAASDATSQVCGFAVGLAIALLGGSYWAIVAQQLSSAFVGLLTTTAMARWVPGMPRRNQQMGSLLRFGWNTFLAQVVNYLSANVSTIVIGQSWGQAAVGYYSRAYQLAFTPSQQIASPLTRVMLPRLSAQASDSDRFLASGKRSQLVLMYTVGSLLGLLAATASVAVPLVLGPNWGQAVPLIPILTVNAVLSLMAYSFYWLLLAKGRTRLLLVTELLARSVMVVLIIFGVRFGLIWVAWASNLGALLLVTSYLLIGLPRIGVTARSVLPATLRPIMVLATPTLAAWVTISLCAPQVGDVISFVLALLVWALVGLVEWLIVPTIRRDVQVILSEARKVVRK